VITFTCPHCQAALSAADRQRGQAARCRHCHGTLQVPGTTTVEPSDRDDRPRRRYPPEAELEPAERPVRAFDVFAGVVGIITWVGCLLWTLLWLVILWGALSRATGAPQEAAAGAIAAAHLIAGYVVARCVQFLLGERFRR
jgi:hypothetical protein